MDFPGGPVVKTSSSKVRVASSIPDQGAKIPHASWLKSQTKTMVVVKGEACAESPGGILEVGKVHMWGSLRALGLEE